MTIKLENIWSDGQSKSKTVDQTVPFAGDWSDGQSIMFVAYSTLSTFLPINIILQQQYNGDQL